MLEHGRTWVVMPFVDLWEEFTRAAAGDVLGQTAPTRLLLVSNGSIGETVAAQRWLAERGSHLDRSAMLWYFAPMLTLSQVWNRALEMVWKGGGERALVVNNDLRLPRQLLEHLHRAMDETGALFTSAINVMDASRFGKGDWASNAEEWVGGELPFPDLSSRGGPDYSCFLISRECHERFPFDDRFTYCNDLDHHRRVMLAGEGRRIFSVCVPYLHFASQTIRRRPELAKVADQHRAIYAEKWGGGVNAETFLEPYTEPSRVVRDDWAYGRVAKPPVTTPELQQRVHEEELPGGGHA